MTEFVFAEMNLRYSLPRELKIADIQRVAEKADCILFQEAKYINLHRILGEEWIVLHDTTSEATAGSAIAVRKSRVKRKARRKPRVLKRLRVGVEPHANPRTGARAYMLTRYIASARFWIDGKLLVNAFSVHLPPARYGWLWAEMAAALIHFAGRHRNKLIAGDWNRGLRSVAEALRALKLKPYDGGSPDIVGFLLASGFKVLREWKVRTHSDHPVVFVAVSV